MDFLFDLGRELLFVTAAAACLEMILPESTIRRPLRFIFGLWFLALLLNPLISLISDTDLNEIARSFGNTMNFRSWRKLMLPPGSRSIGKPVSG